MTEPPTPQSTADDRTARRDFLIRCGRFAAVTPPAMTMLLATSSIPRDAYASTIGRHGDDEDNQG
jgi:hypothetical protein